jgi:predicted Zn-dependent protease with MMP-like domain
MIEVPMERFEELAGDALDLLPEPLAAAIDNVVVHVVETSGDPDLLGLYEGIPLTERGGDYGMFSVTPDQVSIYRRPICAICSTEAEVVEQVRVTVIHELAHHFGIDDDRLEELGYG